MDYSRLIKRAGQITWRYKFLWIFGVIMALCGQGSGGRANFQMNYRVPAPFDPETGFPEFPAFFPEPLGQTPISVYIVAGLSLLIVFLAVALVVGAIGRGALIKSVGRVETGESISLATSWRDGLAKAVLLGLLQAILYGPLVILWTTVAIVVLTRYLPFFGQLFKNAPNLDRQGPPPFVDDFFTFFPLFISTICGVVCISFILQIVIALFLTFGSRGIVLENKGVFDSFSRSWFLFRKNLGPTILLAFIMFLIATVVSVVLAIPAMAIMFPIMISTMPNIFSDAGPSTLNYVLLGGAGIVIFLIFSFVNGVLSVFVEALWTLAYREFVLKVS